MNFEFGEKERHEWKEKKEKPLLVIVGYIKVRQLYRVLSPLAHVLLLFCVE